MTTDRFTMLGIESIEARIRQHAEELAYVSVWDRTDRTTDEPVGRFDMEDRHALPYLEEAPRSRGLLAGLTEPDDPQGWGQEDEDDGDEPEGDQDEQEDYLSAEQLAVAACRWLRSLAMRCTMGEEQRRFRVRLNGVKGHRVLDSGSFLCRNDDYAIQIAPAPAKKIEMPKPSFEDAAAQGGAKAMRELGNLYAQWGHIVIGSVDQLQGVNNSMNAQLHRQLRDAREQVDQLVAAILTFRHKQAMSADEKERDERNDETRALLARDAINQLGEAARAFLATRGLSPEMAEVLGLLGNSPELSAALADPEVRTLMQDPDNLSALAAMLRQAAAQARAAREAGQAEQGAEQDQGQSPQPDAYQHDNPQPAAG